MGVPGTVAGLHMAWKEHGKLPWRRLVEPAIGLAREGFVVTDGLARSLQGVLPEMKPYPRVRRRSSRAAASPTSRATCSSSPTSRETLERIADRGPAGFYEGETAALDREGDEGGRRAHHARRPRRLPGPKRTPLRGTYRGYDVLTMPPISSGGTALLEMLNMLEGYDLKAKGFGSADTST